MADKKISQLSAATPIVSDELVPVVQDGETKRSTPADLFRGLPDGTAAAPSLAFANDPDTGLKKAASGADLVADGGTVANFRPGQFILPTGNSLRLADGSASAPALSFSGDTDTGLYKSATNRIAVAAAGAPILQIKSDGFVMQDAKNIDFQSATGTKIGTAATQKLAFYGATPVVQQNVPLTSPTVQDVIDALVALGLVEQSD